MKRARTLLLLVMTSLLLPVAAVAQEPRAGIVAALQGTATVVHITARAAAPLKFKDDVFVRDRITTGEKSIVRVLLGGKATVTAREYTVLTITEVPGTATISVASGRIAVAVSKDRMKPGDVVQIATPNVVAGVRGTVVVAEVAGDRSAITVLRGLIDVTRIDPATGHAVGQSVLVGPRQQIRVSGVTLSPLPQPTRITPEKARSLTADFTVIPKNPPAASVAPVTRDAVARAAQDLAAVLPRGGGSGNAQGSGSVSAGSNANGKGGSGGGAVAANPGGGNQGTSPGNGGAALAVAPGDSGNAPGLALGNGGNPGNGGGNGNGGSGGGSAGAVNQGGSPGNGAGNGLGLGNGGGATAAAPGNSGNAPGLALGNSGNPGNGGGASAVTPVDSGNAPGLALGNGGNPGNGGGNGLGLGNGGGAAAAAPGNSGSAPGLALGNGGNPGNGGGAPVVSAPALGGGAAPVSVAPGNSGGTPGLGLGNPGKGGAAPGNSGGKGKP